MSGEDSRRSIPGTDQILGLPEFRRAIESQGRERVLSSIRNAQDDARRGEIRGDQVLARARSTLDRVWSGTAFLNATGIVVHTNLGRAPLSEPAVAALLDAAGYCDVELDPATGRRARRGRGALRMLTDLVPDAESALVVNNGAAALLLATTTLAAGRRVILSRGEMLEIGDGFRLHELITSAGAEVLEVGTSNRTYLHDYTDAIDSDTGCVLKVHPSNFTVEGFVSSVDIGDLTGLRAPLVVDIGSGLLRPSAHLPTEPDATSVLRAGADVVLGSGDKLLGGPQCGIVLGRADLVERMRRHPLARALRVDKLTLAALEGTLRSGTTPVAEAIGQDAEELLARTQKLAQGVGHEVRGVDGFIGGGGAPGHALPGWAVALPISCASALRLGSPAVLARVHEGACLVDLRCIPRDRDAQLLRAILAALGRS